MDLPQLQVDLLTHLHAAGGSARIDDLCKALGIDQSPATAGSQALAEAGLVTISETPYEELTLGKDGEPYVASPLPERRIALALRSAGGSAKITDLPELTGLDASAVGQSLRWLAAREWAVKQGEDLVLQPAGAALRDEDSQPDEQLLQSLASQRVARRSDLESRGVPVGPGLELLSKRRGFVTVKERVERRVTLTDAGKAALDAGLRGRRQVTQLTPELLAEGGWREVDLAPYDVTLAAKKLYAGKEHAFQRTLDRVRRVFLELGFTEVASPWVESSFWDFDALFQPQDHPARDMQDTFYVSRPARCELPDADVVDEVRRTHEDGGSTGSTGWRYRWSAELAAKPVLRTHTTAATIRALARHNSKTAGKYFVIGPVFRRETVDYKHLPVFHQVDGIIVDPSASLASLLGTLQAFYSKMGFPKVRFRPSFFPYTEPSAEVFLWLEDRKEWVEMGGSGIFRPEVTQPLGITDRVLAWGLGLERLAMMLLGLKAIGDLYFATMPWLRETPIRRG